MYHMAIGFCLVWWSVTGCAVAVSASVFASVDVNEDLIF